MPAKSLSMEAHYFRLDKRLAINWERLGISRPAMMAYLLLLRAANPRSKWCANVGANKAREVLSMPSIGWEKATKELVELELIRPRPERKTGYFRCIAYEVSTFPRLSRKDSNEEKRYYPPEGWTYIPSHLVDIGWLSNLDTNSELKTALLIYTELELVESKGVRPAVIHAHSRHGKGLGKIHGTFGDGFSERLAGKTIYEVEPYHTWDSWDGNETLDKYGLTYKDFNDIFKKPIRPFELIPAVIRQDETYSYMNIVKREIVKDQFNFDSKDLKGKYLTYPLEQNERVIWILRPWNSILPQNGDWLEFTKQDRRLSYPGRVSV